MGICIDDSEVVCSFIANEISLGDYHGLFRVITRLLQFFWWGSLDIYKS